MGKDAFYSVFIHNYTSNNISQTASNNQYETLITKHHSLKYLWRPKKICQPGAIDPEQIKRHMESLAWYISKKESSNILTLIV